jgi:sulfite exporter TauE/SafE
MGIGTSIFLLAVGAVLAFAVNADISGLSLFAVGIILMVAGAIGLAVSLVARMRDTGDTEVVRDRTHHA